MSRTEIAAPAGAVDPRRAQTSLASATAAVSAGSPFLLYSTYPTSSWPEAVAIGDVDGDGRNDVVMVTSYYFDAANDNMLHVWTQNADGTLGPRVKYAIGGTPSSVAVGDVNNDGRNDVLVANGSGLGVLTQNAQGTLDPIVLKTTTNAALVRIADLNHDGLQDVVGIGWGTGTVSVFLQRNNGTLAAQVLYSAPHAGYDDLEVGDVNGDGLTDVVVMSGQGYAANFSILYQQQNGTLGAAVSRSVGVNQLAGGIGVGDVTGDSKNDVVVGMNWAGGGTPEIDVFPQQPDGSLLAGPSASRPMGYPEPIEVGDVTNDGRGDVVAFDGYVSDLALFRQSAGGQLGNEEMLDFPYATHLNRHGMAIGDINGDGYQDLVVANYNYGLIVYRNAGLQLTVTAPTGSILVGAPTLVEWAPNFDFPSFDVSYSVNGGMSYSPVPGCQGLPPATTSCTWASPGPATNDGRVKVVGRNGAGAILGTGVVSVTILEPFIRVTSPNSPVIWPAGVTQAITWSSNLGPTDSVAIELSRDGGASWASLSDTSPNTGFFLWPVTNPSTASARVRVTWTGNPAVTDSSDVNFTIDRPPVANAGPDVTIELGYSATLNGAASSDPDGDPLSYTWYKGPDIVGTGVATAVTPLETTTYLLVVADPFGLTASTLVSVRVEDTTPPAVIVLSPAAGSVLDVGVPVNVVWTAADTGTLTFFDVSASRDSGATYTPVAGCTHLPADARSCSWTPSPTTTGTAVIRVVGRDSANNGGAGGASYSVSAYPSLMVTAPNGRESWRAGSRQAVTWTHNLGRGACMTIDLSRDGGRSWRTIAPSECSQTDTAGTYSWLVTGPVTRWGRIRITWIGHGMTDTSDADFSIVRPQLRRD